MFISAELGNLLKLIVCWELKFSLLAAAMNCSISDGASSRREGLKHKDFFLLHPQGAAGQVEWCGERRRVDVVGVGFFGVVDERCSLHRQPLARR